MNGHRKRMQLEWLENSRKYTDPIGMTGRRPVEAEFAAIVEDIGRKIDLQSKSSNRILDVGCNNGFLMDQLKPRARMIVGADFCMLPLQEGKKISETISFIQAEAGSLPFPDGSFDRVICYSLMHYLPSEAAALAVAAELLRVTAIHGRMFIGDVFSRDHRELIPREYIDHWDSADRPFMHRLRNWLFVSLESLQQQLESAADCEVELLPHENTIRCPSFRFDILVRKSGGLR